MNVAVYQKSLQRKAQLSIQDCKRNHNLVMQQDEAVLHLNKKKQILSFGHSQSLDFNSVHTQNSSVVKRHVSPIGTNHFLWAKHRHPDGRTANRTMLS